MRKHIVGLNPTISVFELLSAIRYNHLKGQNMDRLANGTKVWIQIDPNKVAADWSPFVLPLRRDRTYGIIQAHHDSHGLCYDVLHDDGTVGRYDPHEVFAGSITG